MPTNRPLRVMLARPLVGLGILCVVLGALLLTISRSLVNSEVFSRRAAAALEEPAVSAFVADRITTLAISRRPDLIRVRPLVLGAANWITASKPFAVVVQKAAYRAHEAFFSRGGRALVLSLPDVDLLLRDALQTAGPEAAAKLPPKLGSLVFDLGHSKVLEVTIDLWRLAHRVRNLGGLFLLLGVGLTVLGIAVAHDRYHSLSTAGTALICGALLLGAILPLGRVLALELPRDPLLRGAFIGLWRTYLGGLGAWALFLGGLGVLCTAAANSLMERLHPRDLLAGLVRRVADPPDSRLGRVAWGVGLLLAGSLAIAFPDVAMAVVAVILGLALSYMGVREIFRLVLESVAEEARQPGAARVSWHRPVLVLVLLAGAAGTWIVLRRPVTPPPPPTSATACNGHPELCGRRLDEVTFAAAHNSMSNASIADWMFPHHQAGIKEQLKDGIRALLLDVHYGFPGGERIKTDLQDERHTRDKLVEALGSEAVAAAERIRERLVGVDEGRRGLYLCHGFCELGATSFTETLRDIREFLVTHPEEVLMMVIEDYVSPGDLAAAFSESGLEEFVYQGPSGPPWPTLGEMVESGGRVAVFLESGTPGVDWLRPAFDNIQETPYTFHTPEEFSCRPNRGGTKGSLFQINHWIETTPTPLPSNAELVNSTPVLMQRVLRCARERGRRPNIIAVDFYRSGDLFTVVDSLNGVH